MKILTYNVMNGGVNPPARLEQVMQVLSEQDADVFGLQETDLKDDANNRLLRRIREGGTHPYGVVFDRDGAWTYGSAAAMFSKTQPSSSSIVGERVRVVEMNYVVNDVIGDVLSICNVYLSHKSEAERLPQVREILEEVGKKKLGVLIGDFNALSPQDGLNSDIVQQFSPKMMGKYTRDGKLCFDTIEAVLSAGYVYVGLLYHRAEEITDRTDLSDPKTGGGHTLPMRMDFIFAKRDLVFYLREFTLVRSGLARTASDHFPWHVTIDESLFRKKDQEIVGMVNK